MTGKQPYPQDPRAWQEAIAAGLNLEPNAAREAYRNGTFPYETFEVWIKAQFSEGYSPAFVPALLRNIRGLAAWVYGGGEEPYWPGSDEDTP